MKKHHHQEPEQIFGVHPVLEAIKAGKDIDKLWVQPQANSEGMKELLETAKLHSIPISRVPVEKLNKLTYKNHQGVVAAIAAVSYASLDYIVSEAYAQGKMPFILALDHITDVRNFGAIVRSAECAGVDAILIPSKGAAQVGRDAVKTSAGALHYMPICRTENFIKTLKELQASGLEIVACTEKTNQTIYSKQDLHSGIVVVMGSEDTGISTPIIRMADFLLKIPLAGNINSLNVSVATAVILYEIVRQRMEHKSE